MTCAPNIYTHICYFYSTQNYYLIDIFYRVIIVIANTVLYIYIHVHVSIYAALYIHCTRFFFFKNSATVKDKCDYVYIIAHTCNIIIDQKSL